MSKKGKKDDVDFLEGFDFDGAFAGKIKDPEAFVPDRADKVASNLDQSSTKVASNLDQSSIKVASNLKSSYTKVAPKPAPQLRSKLDQSSIKVASNLSFQSLAGLQRNSLVFIYESCRILGSKISPPIQIKNLAESTKTSIAAARVAVQRIEQKGFVRRFEYKDGRGGWTRYELPDQIYSQLLFSVSSIKVASNLDQSSIKVAPEPAPQPAPSSPSSSRDLYIKNTTTTSDVEKFEFKLDQVSEFGLTASAVSRCFELYPNLENEKMQDLLNRFAQFMRSGDGKRVQNARGFFISLAEQMSKGMTPLDHIETAEAILMRELVSKKRAQKAEQDSLEKEIQDFDFEDWWSELLPQDRDLLVPPNNIALPGSSSQKLIAKQVHAEKFWPERRVRVLQEASPDI